MITCPADTPAQRLSNILEIKPAPDDFWKYHILGSRQKIITQDCAGFWFVYKAHAPVHIGICAGACNAVDGPKDKQDV